MIRIGITIRPEGSAGYVVQWQIMDGEQVKSPPIALARYDEDFLERQRLYGISGFLAPVKVQKALAEAHRQGMKDGMRSLANVTESLVVL